MTITGPYDHLQHVAAAQIKNLLPRDIFTRAHLGIARLGFFDMPYDPASPFLDGLLDALIRKPKRRINGNRSIWIMVTSSLQPIPLCWAASLGRVSAFCELVRSKGLNCHQLSCDTQSYAAGRASIRQHAELIHGCDGLFGTTDLLACGALDGLKHDLFLRVPEDIRVVGFDDIEQASWVPL
jgi:hypothetical protein